MSSSRFTSSRVRLLRVNRHSESFSRGTDEEASSYTLIQGMEVKGYHARNSSRNELLTKAGQGKGDKHNFEIVLCCIEKHHGVLLKRQERSSLRFAELPMSNCRFIAL